jgi:hypothetical protein
MTLAKATEAQIAWARSVQAGYRERVRALLPPPSDEDTGREGGPDWEWAQAEFERSDPELARDYARSREYLGPYSAIDSDDVEPDEPGPVDNYIPADDSELFWRDSVEWRDPEPPGGRFDGDESDWWLDVDPVGEFQTDARQSLYEAQRQREAGELAAAEQLTERARLATVAADELLLDADDSRFRGLDFDRVKAERDWVRASSENARLVAQPFPPAAPPFASAARRREAAQALNERVAGGVEWARALRAVHFQRAQAEWRRLIRDGAEPSDELAVQARQGVHLRDEKLAALVPLSTDTLRRAGEFPVRVDEPTAELRDRYAAIKFRLTEVEAIRFELEEPVAELDAEATALRSAADDLALSEGYAPEAFEPVADEPQQEPAPRRRRVIDLLPKLPRPPSRPTPESVAQQSASTRGPSSSPDLS